MAPDPKPTPYNNRLLRILSSTDRALLDPHLEPQTLEERHPFEKPNKPVKEAYFIESGIASVVARAANGEKVEVGLVGPEGMTGLVLLLGNDRTPNESYMQLAGHGLSIPAAKLRDAMNASATLHRRLLTFVQAFTIQASHTALANARGTLEERLARWLLMAHDRIERDELPLKHDFLAVMLGVRRPGVTVALKELADSGLIQTNRGSVIVSDREGLEEVANSLYGTPEAEYERLLGGRH
jgi:CRP-like cAMP-binding protein